MRDVFTNLPPGAVRLNGPLGNALALTIRNRLKKVNYAHLVDPFRFRREKDGLWRCEFWGKIVRSAIHAWRASGDPELLAMVRGTVADLLSTQTSDGCISSYPAERQLSGWDIWGRKYVLLALVRYDEEIEHSKAVAVACRNMLAHLIGQIEKSGERITYLGEHQGLAASSILGAAVGVYRITGEKCFLDFAEKIAASGCSRKHNVFHAALAGIPPAETGNGKAYELTSCFQGLAALRRLRPDAASERALERYWELVEQYEIFITGIGGLKDMGGEYWDYGKWRQTRNDTGVMLGETCITTTWVRFSDDLLRSTGNAKVANSLERTFYNGVLGAMKPDGTGWTHGNPTPLAGTAFKRSADDQITGFGEDCCLAQGPEALAMAPLSAVMKTEGGLVVNVYEDLEADFKTPSGNSASLSISGNYPFSGLVRLRILLRTPEEFRILFRIPEWGNTVLKIGEDVRTCVPGTYSEISRVWNADDKVELEFDLAPRTVVSPDISRIAYCSGPLVLAQDSRLSEVDQSVRENARAERISPPEGIHAAWRLDDGTKLCCYADAGNEFSRENPFTVWFRKTKN